MTNLTLAAPYDFAVLDNSEQPRSIVYHLDGGPEVATFGDDPLGQRQAEVVSTFLNAMDRPITRRSTERKLFIQSQLDGTTRIEVIAVAADANAANAYCEANPGVGVVDQWGPLILLARNDDLGS
ncbi:hypothetical protein [Sphingosinicella sp. BN140058]|uniref:hypothetical protein n=1 Tax=Sphingosinicella sp. BN140058 TaxID=1892855 RepID=UPI001010C793|nr:hypothetical protein [Sphingosinicella sp. BN140058]QAY80414.1 hypothetical protein ETR14_27630 [Sphingosinicella sp. BN140058]